jgi:hypothetical protein
MVQWVILIGNLIFFKNLFNFFFKFFKSFKFEGCNFYLSRYFFGTCNYESNIFNTYNNLTFLENNSELYTKLFEKKNNKNKLKKFIKGGVTFNCKNEKKNYKNSFTFLSKTNNIFEIIKIIDEKNLIVKQILPLKNINEDFLIENIANQLIVVEHNLMKTYKVIIPIKFIN